MGVDQRPRISPYNTDADAHTSPTYAYLYMVVIKPDRVIHFALMSLHVDWRIAEARLAGHVGCTTLPTSQDSSRPLQLGWAFIPGMKYVQQSAALPSLY